MNDYPLHPPEEDLDALASALQTAPAAPSRSRAATDGTILDLWLTRVRELGGSDLILVAGSVPMVRAAGKFHPAAPDLLDSEDILSAVATVITPHHLVQFEKGSAIDVAFRRPSLGRFRMNLHRERGRVASAIRALPREIPDVPSLRFSHDIGLLSSLPRGLVLICGPTGSGKTTTLAALVAVINARDARHIITIEDPIEYEHPHARSIVEQVEIGMDAADFPTALRSAVRQAPDIIVVGEMRDPETMRMAVGAAETGHLVFATLHATDAAAAVSRIADGFPVERQNAIRQELAMSLAAVLTQTLVPSIEGSLFPVAELLMVSYGARQHIRKNGLQHLNQEITITRKAGSFTLEESLARCVAQGWMSLDDARLRAVHGEELESLVRRA